MRRHLRFLASLLSLGLGSVAAVADDYSISSEALGYSGSWTRYATLADAMSGMNQLDAGSIPQRDLSLNLASDTTGAYGGNVAAFITLWNYLPASNPNNKNDGFFQLYDYTGTTAPLATVTSNTGAWNATHDVLTVSLTGANAVMDYAGTYGHDEYVRLGIGPDTNVIPSSGSASQVTWGLFHSYQFDASFTVPGAVETAPGIWASNHEATAVTGTFTALFENTAQNTEPNPNSGFYQVTINLNQTSWAASNPDITLATPAFAAPIASPVPEPSGALLLLTATFLCLRRRAKN
jgi:hypothetical protein